MVRSWFEDDNNNRGQCSTYWRALEALRFSPIRHCVGGTTGISPRSPIGTTGFAQNCCLLQEIADID
jgi:hypothetical protein